MTMGAAKGTDTETEGNGSISSDATSSNGDC